MTFLRGGAERLGVLDRQAVVDVTDLYPTMLSLIEAGEEGLQTVRQALASDRERLTVEPDHLLAPIPRPRRNVMCVGWNYLAHFEERFQREAELPKRPTVFTKATRSVTGPFAEIPLSEAFTRQFDYEAELAVVIGKGGRAISEEEAPSHVFGYTIANDLSARDVQHAHGGQWFLGKSMDHSCPMGPCIVTADEVPDPYDLQLECVVNGAVLQSSSTNLMMFSVARIIAELSRGMTLEPGDLILTGTPSGVGVKRDPPVLLKPGDVVEVRVSGIGSIRNRICEYRDMTLDR